MDNSSAQALDYETQHALAQRAELAQRIARAAPEGGRAEPLAGLVLYRASSPSELMHSVYDPAFCMLAQGSKAVYLGDERYWYDPEHYLLTTDTAGEPSLRRSAWIG